MKCDKVCVLGRHFENSSNHGKYVMYGDIYCQHSWRLQIVPRPPCGKSTTATATRKKKKAIGLHCNEQNNNFASA